MQCKSPLMTQSRHQPQRHQRKTSVAFVHGQAHCLPESCPENGNLPKSPLLPIGSLVPSVGTKSVSKTFLAWIPEVAGPGILPSLQWEVSVRRRKFITLLGGASVAWPLARVRLAHAQQGERIRRIGVLMALAESDPQAQAHVARFREELQKLGWVEGRNIRIDIRWTTPRDAGSRQRFAKELVALRPDLILSSTTPTTAALLQQTRTIPIVFAVVADPVGSGFVASFSRPGGNATGFIPVEPTMSGKWLELLKEIAPRVTRVAFLFNPATAAYAEYYLTSFKAAAAALALEAIAAPVRDPSELQSAIAAQARAPHGGLVVMPDSFLVAQWAAITSLAARYHLPAVYPFRFFVELGGLLSYGNDLVDSYRRAATYADRILKGAKPGELPVQAPVKFELVINLKTAKALGLAVPSLLQQRADVVIE